jgi:hydroxylysine kinase
MLNAAYGVEGTLTRLAGENENYLVAGEGGARYVLKLADPDAAEELIALEHAAVEAAHASGLDAAFPRIVRTADGQTTARLHPPDGEPRLGRLLEFVDGTPWHDAGPASDAGCGRSHQAPSRPT